MDVIFEIESSGGWAEGGQPASTLARIYLYKSPVNYYKATRERISSSVLEDRQVTPLKSPPWESVVQ